MVNSLVRSPGLTCGLGIQTQLVADCHGYLVVCRHRGVPDENDPRAAIRKRTPNPALTHIMGRSIASSVAFVIATPPPGPTNFERGLPVLFSWFLVGSKVGAGPRRLPLALSAVSCFVPGWVCRGRLSRSTPGLRGCPWSMCSQAHSLGPRVKSRDLIRDAFLE